MNKLSKRNFVKSILMAVPLSKIIDIEGSENKEVAKKQQENINIFYNAKSDSGHIFSGHNFIQEEHPDARLTCEWNPKTQKQTIYEEDYLAPFKPTK